MAVEVRDFQREAYLILRDVHIGLDNVPPLTEDELSATYDERSAWDPDWLYTKEEFVENALIREAEIRWQDAVAKLGRLRLSPI